MVRKEACITVAETLLCVGPAMTLLYVGKPGAGAAALYSSGALMLAIHLLLGQARRYTSLAVSLIPPVLLVRNQFLYSGVVLAFALGLLLWAAVRPREVNRLLASPVRVALIFGCFLYWAFSWCRTGVYSSNLHAVEFALVASSVFLLGSFRSSLAAGLLGMAVALVCEGVGVFPYGERLGLASIDSISLGNPISFGLAAGLIFLLATAEGGRWLGLDGRPLLRLVVSLVAAGFLVLSTSRGSWLTTLAGVGVSLCFANTYRRHTSWIILLVPLTAIGLALSTGRGTSVRKFYEKVVSPDRTLTQKTTGRFTQWEQAPEAILSSPVWGHGPGSGTEIYRQLSGKRLAWHSMYLQLLVETGGMGFLIFATILAGIAAGAAQYRRRTGEIVPLMAFVCYLVVGLSVAALDAMSAVYLGLALMGSNYCGFWRVYRQPSAPGALARTLPIATGHVTCGY
ncbi:MAG: O-antigen ligase family protein [Acidobacteriaceae bacterium]|nr:O-antigen ligase family protein [Acidobacteriaceae bacterium]